MRRAKHTYIRLAAFFASQPPGARTLVLGLGEIESVMGARLPLDASSESWWHNDVTRVHARAWLQSGWEVAAMDAGLGQVSFIRSGSSLE